MNSVEFESLCWNIVLIISPLLEIKSPIVEELVNNTIKDISTFKEELNAGVSNEIEENIKQLKFPAVVSPEKYQQISHNAKEIVKNRKEQINKTQ